MKAKIGSYTYTGVHGPGVIPQLRASTSNYLVQALVVDTYDPKAVDLADDRIFRPPIATERKPKRRRQQTPTLPGLFPDNIEEIAAPVPDVRATLAPSARPVIAEIQLVGGGRIPVPKSLSALIEENHLTFLREEALFYDPEQARGLSLMTKTAGSMCFVADTGFGKTILQLLFLDWALSHGERALVFVPFDNLVEQFQRDARLFFDFSEESVLFASGQSHSPEERAKLYSGSIPFCLVTTPEAFLHDLDKGRIDPTLFQYRLYDEIHLARGDYAHVQVERTLRPNGGRVFCFTGTFPTEKNVQDSIIETFGLTLLGCDSGKRTPAIHRLYPEPTLKFVKAIFSRPDTEMIQAAELLYTAAARAAYETAAVLDAAMRTEGGTLTDNYIVQKFRKLTKVDRQTFVIPSYKELSELRRLLEKLSEKDRKRFWRGYSWFCEFEHLCFLYTVLVCFGKFAFLLTFADELWATRLPGARPRVKKSKKYRLEGRAFVKRACENVLVRQAFSLLSAHSIFDVLLAPTVTLFGIAKRLPEGLNINPHARPEPRQLFRLYCDAATQHFVERDYLDHPNELRCFDLIRRHMTFGYRDQILVYTNLGKHAPFLARRIEHRLSSVIGRAVSFVGRKHSTLTQRRGVIAAFQRHEVDILVGTKAIATGLDSHAAVLISWTQDSRWEDRSQAEGRIGRKGKPGLNYNLVVPGSREAVRYYQGVKNLQKVRSKNANLQE